jgi:type II secretory ATPase GspE/PulE/Tfp pilus assembly ATPase PilB-like protein
VSNFPPFTGIVTPGETLVARCVEEGGEDYEPYFGTRPGERLVRSLVRHFGQALVRRALCHCLGIPTINIAGTSVSAKIMAHLPESLQREGRAAVVDVHSDGSLLVVLSDPFDYSTGRRLEQALRGIAVSFAIADSAAIAALQPTPDVEESGLFGQLVESIILPDQRQGSSDEEDVERGPEVGDQLVQEIFERAVAARATDVHIDPLRNFESGEEGMKVRFRVDGTAFVQHALCRSGPSGLSAASTIARALRLAGDATAESLASQDFRVYREVASRIVESRVHTRPAYLGGIGSFATVDKTAIRIFDNRIRRLDSLGLSDHLVAGWRSASRESGRLSILSGPTRSGKTTALAATVHETVDDSVIAYSVEDPVEYRISGVSQLEVQATTREQRREYMSGVLYDLMREDPDFVMVGEIRDSDSMSLAFDIALAGAQVMTTTHAGSVTHTIQRLLEWGLDPFIVATTLGGVMNLRLLRRICPHCRVKVSREDGDVLWPETLFGRELPPAGWAKSPEGCQLCRFTGTVGQFSVGELMTVQGTPVEVLRDSARLAHLMDGRRTLEDEAYVAVVEGRTDVAAVYRAHIGTGADDMLDEVTERIRA